MQKAHERKRLASTRTRVSLRSSGVTIAALAIEAEILNLGHRYLRSYGVCDEADVVGLVVQALQSRLVRN